MHMAVCIGAFLPQSAEVRNQDRDWAFLPGTYEHCRNSSLFWKREQVHIDIDISIYRYRYIYVCVCVCTCICMCVNI